MDGQHRTRGPGHHLIGRAPEEEPLQAFAAMGAHNHNDEIDFLLLGQNQALSHWATDSAHQSQGAKSGLVDRGFPGNHPLGLAGGAAARFRFAEILQAK